VDAADYFHSQSAYVPGTAPLDQVEFAGWSPADTKWQSYDSQITPVPEPGSYGALLLVVGTGLLIWRRRRCHGWIGQAQRWSRLPLPLSAAGPRTPVAPAAARGISHALPGGPPHRRDGRGLSRRLTGRGASARRTPR
jgi:hypothetical protein